MIPTVCVFFLQSSVFTQVTRRYGLSPSTHFRVFCGKYYITVCVQPMLATVPPKMCGYYLIKQQYLFLTTIKSVVGNPCRLNRTELCHFLSYQWPRDGYVIVTRFANQSKHLCLCQDHHLKKLGFPTLSSHCHFVLTTSFFLLFLPLEFVRS